MKRSERRVYRYHLRDEGQDLTSFDIDTCGEIVWVELPNLMSIYGGWVSYDYWSKMNPGLDPVVAVGGTLRISKGPDDTISHIKYPVEKIELLSNAVVEVRASAAERDRRFPYYLRLIEDGEAFFLTNDGKIVESSLRQNYSSKEKALTAARRIASGLKRRNAVAKLMLG